MTPLRLGVIGAGQVWRRLYEPALRHTSAFEVAAIADPALVSAGAFATPEALLDTANLDCVTVLSPPSLHSGHVLACIQRSLPVLVEKPPALSTAELDTWEQAGGSSLVRPAFSRRYWPAYHHGGRNGHHWEFALQTSPAAWGATTTDPVARDLLPHAVDLARWLSGEEIASLEVTARSESIIAGVFELSGGGRFSWEVAHGAAYREELRMDGAPVAGDGTILSRIERRLTRQPDRDIAGIAEMLNDWSFALAGASPSRLANFADARTNVATITRVLEAPPGAPS